MTTAHHIGDACPGGHPELIPPPWTPEVVDLYGLVAQISAVIHDESNVSWATRAVQVRRVLHEAGYHTAQMSQTDWRDCPVCSTHPERHADGAP